MSNKWKIFWVAAFILIVFFQACGMHSWEETIVSKADEKQMGREFDSLVRSGSTDVVSAGETLFLPQTTEQIAFDNYYQTRAKEVVNVIKASDLEALIPSENLCGANKQKCTKDNFFEFKIINSKQVNAFAVPGGYIYFYTPILKEFQSESEFINVIAHEIGHVVKHHSRESIVKQVGASVIIDALLGNGMGSILAELGTNFWLLGNSRENEFEADEAAFNYTSALQISSEGLGDFFSRGLKFDASGKCVGEGSSVLDVFSTHPPSCDRINKNNERIKESNQNYPKDKNFVDGKSYKQLAAAAKF